MGLMIQGIGEMEFEGTTCCMWTIGTWKLQMPGANH